MYLYVFFVKKEQHFCKNTRNEQNLRQYKHNLFVNILQIFKIPSFLYIFSKNNYLFSYSWGIFIHFLKHLNSKSAV